MIQCMYVYVTGEEDVIDGVKKGTGNYLEIGGEGG